MDDEFIVIYPASVTTIHRPITHCPTIYKKEKLLQLAAFEATCQDAQTPISPDMVPLIIDTGASITVLPYKTEFTSNIKPVQSIEIDGISEGLQAKRIGDVAYHIYNDTNELQTLTLRNGLYVPQCTARLLCLRQIEIATGNKMNGFSAFPIDPY